MKTSRLDNRRFREIASDLSLPVSEVRRAVGSFFGTIVSYSRTLPFDTKYKIFKRYAFKPYVRVFNIPLIGRIGPVYSRYLSWRTNEANKEVQEISDRRRHKWVNEVVETLASAALSGEQISVPERKKRNAINKYVWIIDKEGKKRARQEIRTQ